jgi:predicted MPP superfamily phosphohydrolase
VFGIILLLAFTGMQVYVFWRAGSVPFLKRHVSRKMLVGTGLLLWAVFSLARLTGHGGENAFSWMIEFIGMNWMAAVFLATVCLLAVDVVTGFGLLLPRLASSMRGLALLTALLLSVAALIQGMRPPVVRNYEVSLRGLPRSMDGTVVVAMSDLHVGTLLGKRWLDARIAQVQAQHPDIVVLLGDIFEGHGRPRPDLLQDLHRLSAPLGVWAVLGNHEYHGLRAAGTSWMYDGIPVLSNSWAEVRPGLLLAGVEDLTANHRSGDGGDPVSRALAGRSPGATILLSHTPWQAEKAAGAGVGLMLSGHTHGGQIWPFGYLVKRLYPLFGGRYEVNGMTVIVCRGTGTWGPRMRLWRPGEILRVTLRSGPMLS